MQDGDEQGVDCVAPNACAVPEPPVIYAGICEADDDGDNDGVPAASDCDDVDPFVSALIYESGFETDDSYFSSPRAAGPLDHRQRLTLPATPPR